MREGNYPLKLSCQFLSSLSPPEQIWPCHFLLLQTGAALHKEHVVYATQMSPNIPLDYTWVWHICNQPPKVVLLYPKRLKTALGLPAQGMVCKYVNYK